ncbi:MAG: type II secretion system major pseudopilin GspG [Verrucomicrobia bacterium]|nr:type II secretion system major pseudopilin GspG [Verrucomicrobiota bacterium]
MKAAFRSARRLAAFTLLEIMLVVAIIMLLLGAGAFFLGDFIGVGRTARVQADISTLTTSLRTYQMVNGFYPSSSQGLNALVTQPGGEPKPRVWNQLMSQLPKDPWGNEYVYVCPGRKNPKGFDLYSKGADGQEGTPDDVGNWQ